MYQNVQFLDTQGLDREKIRVGGRAKTQKEGCTIKT